MSGISVTLSTGISGTTPTGVILTETTNSSGQVTFTNLPSSGQLCVSAATGIGASFTFNEYCAQSFPSSYTLAI